MHNTFFFLKTCVEKFKHAQVIFYNVFSMNEVKENQKVGQEKRERKKERSGEKIVKRLRDSKQSLIFSFSYRCDFQWGWLTKIAKINNFFIQVIKDTKMIKINCLLIFLFSTHILIAKCGILGEFANIFENGFIIEKKKYVIMRL